MSTYVTHPRFPDYEISSEGRVFRLVQARYFKPGTELLGRVLSSGYRQFNLRNAEGEREFYRANRLVAEAFLGAPPTAAHQAAHFDGDRLNNSVGNLRWATAQENCDDKRRHGTLACGSRIGTSVYSETQVLAIRAAYAEGRSRKDIAAAFGVNVSALDNILYGHHWRHLPIVRSSKPRRDWTPAEVDELRRRKAEGQSYPTISAALGRSRSAVEAKGRPLPWGRQ